MAVAHNAFPAGIVTESQALVSAPWYRREPYLLFFPLGVLLSWAGVGHWLLHGLGLLETYRPIFHAMTQIQSFLACFAAGFLMTMIPRRTGSAPPAAWEIALCAAAPVITALAAWNDRWVLAQAAWLALAATMIAFAVRRFLSATSKRRPPNAFVWIPLAWLMGIAGSLMTAFYYGGARDSLWLHEVGRRLVLQGMFCGLVLGVGSLAFPLMTRGQAPPDAAASSRDRVERALHLASAALLIASFFVEVMVSLRWAMLLRASVVAGSLVFGAELWRLPLREGANRTLVWACGWMLPLGYLLAAVFPGEPRAGLHVVFIGGFATLALAVSTQVTLGHRGYRSVMLGRPWQVTAIAALMAAAMAARFAMEFDRARYFTWMVAAAACFVAATAVWAAFLVPKMLFPAETDESEGR
jgi:uncharacterized protein involved in response to NO